MHWKNYFSICIFFLSHTWLSFHDKQIQSLEESAESLSERCLKFYKGCHKYTEGLGEGYDRDVAFASSLEMFGGGHSDPISVAFGGPVMTKFTIALREIGTYTEVLRSQVGSINLFADQYAQCLLTLLLIVCLNYAFSLN
ncbi:hypothetical protein BHE74_00006841 [Ensete ventricosum]|uniref:Uncharacterized protein n=1 Tax=Ensete ventricosum TaxID=4639 RepID=A0A426ZFI7_ENSVE|nr:hypothetical protein B296_00038248 [Ensete ventricosum]RWW84542.1 hypothetical protein BHE74_00006841 [Ensete ventricosum]RZR97229.1 hypothetical protein BHM03_00026368 [Ensete ventricosum]